MQCVIAAVSIGVHPTRVSVNPMGVDLVEKFVPNQKQGHVIDVIYVGRLVEKKGVQFLLHAFAKVVNQYPRARLKIVGHGPLQPSLEALRDELGLGRSVEFKGAVENDRVPDELRGARVAVFPSN